MGWVGVRTLSWLLTHASLGCSSWELGWTVKAAARPPHSKIKCSGAGGRKRIWLTAGDLGEAMGSDEGGDGNHGIVAEMEEETGDDGAGVGTGKGEDDTDQNEQADDAPGPAELRAVHQTEEDSGKQNAGNDAEGFREQRIEIAAENGFLDERRDEDRHGP